MKLNDNGNVVLVDVVAPYVGAWIETSSPFAKLDDATSHPTWVRGLKLFLKLSRVKHMMSHPTWVRGLKHVFFTTVDGC